MNRIASLVAVNLALSLAAAGAGCGAAPKASETLMDSVRGYHDGLRWQRYPTSATMIPPAERDLFLDERDEIADDLRISEYEITRVSFDDGQDRAVLRVRYTWFLDSQGTVHDTTSEQRWERRGKRWLLVEEERVRGEPMPGVPEPDEEPEDTEPEPEARRTAGR
jgi:hypothetical protein